MKYLKNRFDNTFKGRSFIEGIKLLNKPALKPTIMDDEKEKTEEDDKLWSRFCYDFELDKNFVLDYYDCEMCFKSTKTRIDCGHSLCLECLIHLEVDSCEHYYYRQCPLCHQHIHSLMK